MQLTQESPGVYNLSWWGRSGWTYFIQQSEDLVNWQYVPVVEAGGGEVISWGFSSTAERQFFRLRLSDAPAGGDPGAADFDGDGMGNAQELAAGGDPLNYYRQGSATVVPVLEVVSGDNQYAPASQFTGSPLVVKVKDLATGVGLVNAPVNFSVAQGGKLALSNQGTPELKDATQLRSDAGGLVQVYYKQPAFPETESSITVTAGAAASLDLHVYPTVISATPNPLIAEVALDSVSPRTVTLTNRGTQSLDFNVATINTNAFDGANYHWKDSDMANGPVYVWNDISSSGSLLASVSEADDAFEEAALSFSFPFYGQTFTRIFVGSNGYVTLGEGSDEYANASLPSEGMPGGLIAALFDDLSPRAGGDIFFQDFGDHAVVQFQNVSFYGGGGAATFQIVLWSNGDIFFYYKQLSGTLSSSTVGLQNPAMDIGTLVAFNEVYLKDELAVRINSITPWLSVSPASGAIAAGQSVELTATFQAPQYLAGSPWEGTILVDHDLPGAEPLELPVKLIVNPLPEVAFTAPRYRKNITEGQPVTLVAQASDNSGQIDQVEFFAGTASLQTFHQAPYEWTWSTPPLGNHAMTVKATDGLGAVGISPQVLLSVQVDSDGDGLGDDWELQYYGSLDEGPTENNDDDGASALEEFEHGSDPGLKDTDGDGIPDGYEITHGLDVRRNDADGDIDGDLFSNIEEFLAGTLDSNPSSTPFKVLYSRPVDGETNVTLDKVLVLGFDRSLPMSLGASIVSVELVHLGSGQPVRMTRQWMSDHRTFAILPSSDLEAGQVYEIKVQSDSSSGFFCVPYRIVFETEPVSSPASKPYVMSTNPGAGSVHVSPSIVISTWWSEPLDESTVNTTAFALAGPDSNPVPFSVAYDPYWYCVKLTPLTTLQENTTYTASVLTGGVANLRGQTAAVTHRWSFTTKSPPLAVPDTGPHVISTTPGHHFVNVSRDAAIRVAWSEPLDQSTLIADNIQLINQWTGDVVPLNITYAATGNLVTLQPLSPLGWASGYRLVFGEGVKSASGEAFEQGGAWELVFRTRPSTYGVQNSGATTGNGSPGPGGPGGANSGSGGGTGSGSGGTDESGGNDPGEGGAADGGKIFELPVGWGDPSGSASEIWALSVVGQGPDDYSTSTLNSSDFGQVSQQTFAVTRNNKYEITLKHTRTRPEYMEQNQSSDYDWQAQLEGNPPTPVKGPGDNAGQSGQYVVAAEHWLVDNTNGLLGTVDDSFDSQDHSTGKKATMVPVIKRDEEGGTVEWKLIAGALAKVLPGQRMNLKVDVSDLPNAPSVNNFHWAVTGGKFKDYTADGSQGVRTMLQQSEYEQQDIHYYWSQTGVQKVQLICDLNGQQHVFKTPITVVDPGSTLSAPIGTTQITGGGYTIVLQGISSGIAFNGKVKSIATEFGTEGEWTYVQTLNEKRTDTARNGTAFTLLKNKFWGETVLDTTFPYPNSIYATGESRSSHDTPSTVFGLNHQLTTVEDLHDFKVYIIFKPPGENSKWVPLRKVDWSWNWKVTDKIDGGGWKFDYKNEASSESTPTHTHPEWTKNWKDDVMIVQ
ncbi:Ig-like domain-containing protein [Verrucomicrobium spinosum]|uniref:Ig-like domain-containing protein n=1 Tax=Verrucomicrobium spinosum TaxID=2736 RepID=UPI00155DA9A5|nr:Ig-like domain-containing protein [Verrucomicrobium spinosum]